MIRCREADGYKVKNLIGAMQDRAMWIILVIIALVTPLYANAEKEEIVGVEAYIDEAKRLNDHVLPSIDGAKIKEVVEDYGKEPKEKGYRERELRSKAEGMLISSKRKAEDESLSVEERSEANAAAVTHDSKISMSEFEKIDQESWMKKSDEVTKSPLVGVNSSCKISGEVKDDITAIGEPYEVEVKDKMEVENEELCEEDSTEIHKCESKLVLKCVEKLQTVEEAKIIWNQSGENKYYVNNENLKKYHSWKSMEPLLKDKSYFTISTGGTTIKEIYFMVEKKNLLKNVILDTRLTNKYYEGIEEGHICALSINGALKYSCYLGGIVYWGCGKAEGTQIDITDCLNEGTNTLGISNNIGHRPLYRPLVSWILTYETEKHYRNECIKWEETWENNCGGIK